MEDHSNRIIEIQYGYEDELPEDLTQEEYDGIFSGSIVVGVRMFPYIKIAGVKYYLSGVQSNGQ